MRTRRTLPTLALLAFATIGLAACVAINETVTERDYDCGEVQDTSASGSLTSS